MVFYFDINTARMTNVRLFYDLDWETAVEKTSGAATFGRLRC